MNDLLVMLEIDGRRAAIPAIDVETVMELEDIYPVPRAPDYVVGLTAMRSRSLTVIDTRRAIGVNCDTPWGERAVVVEIDSHQYALLVDAVHDVSESQSDIMPVAGGFGPEWERVGKGMIETAHGPALLLDIKPLVARTVAEAA